VNLGLFHTKIEEALYNNFGQEFMDDWDRERTESEHYADELRKRLERKMKRIIQRIKEEAAAARAKIVGAETDYVQNMAT